MGKLNFGRVKPSFLIIGTQKGGTTSLHGYLLQHPRLKAPPEKELHFFDSLEDRPIEDYIKKYPKLFFNNSILFETTPRYISYPGVAKKIYEFDPKMKFIVLLRNPVERAYSAWNMYRQMANDELLVSYFKRLETNSPKEQLYTFFYKDSFPSFENWVNFEMSSSFPEKLIEPSIVRRGYYVNQIKNYFKYFNEEQFLFIDSEELKKNTLNILNSIARLLSITDFTRPNLDLSVKHKRDYEQPLSNDFYNKLLLHYQYKNKGLEELTSLNLDWMKLIN